MTEDICHDCGRQVLLATCLGDMPCEQVLAQSDWVRERQYAAAMAGQEERHGLAILGAPA